ncbi:hypothetical protein N656DRAFT_338574 [Canariomyces notabilis]|uniref:Uncharacterized protein n=1 Tax=Canariomyces notabilis TaxID=2074819 RepID=A0AAN6QGW7_9PEZI|nr:hypothetical protein N656DRAFT_338574 [Canariomyces arenarius]
MRRGRPLCRSRRTRRPDLHAVENTILELRRLRREQTLRCPNSDAQECQCCITTSRGHSFSNTIALAFCPVGWCTTLGQAVRPVASACLLFRCASRRDMDTEPKELQHNQGHSRRCQFSSCRICSRGRTIDGQVDPTLLDSHRAINASHYCAVINPRFDGSETQISNGRSPWPAGTTWVKALPIKGRHSTGSEAPHWGRPGFWVERVSTGRQAPPFNISG